MRVCAVGKEFLTINYNINIYLILLNIWDLHVRLEFFAVDLWPKLEVQQLINKKKMGDCNSEGLIKQE